MCLGLWIFHLSLCGCSAQRVSDALVQLNDDGAGRTKWGVMQNILEYGLLYIYKHRKGAETRL